MKDPIQKFFRVGTIQWMSYPLSDPMEVPGGERVFHATDPHGAVFGLVAPQ